MPAPQIAPNLELDPLASGEQLLAADSRLGDGDRYRIDDIIAIGGMATVYKAYDLRLNLRCAIKALFLPATEDEHEERAFESEARLLASLHYPGIVGVRDYFLSGEFAFLAMDFIEGQNLYDRHRRTARPGEDTENLAISSVPEDQVTLYGVALAEALEYLHTRAPAILYRDMKPHNVMRRASDGAVVLLDFGIARRMRKRSQVCLSDDLGTPGYAAPEQYESGGVLDARTDIFSLGVVLAELATGYNPRDEDAPTFPPPIADLSATLSPGLEAIIQKCLEIRPGDRFQSARELIDSLQAWQSTPRSARRKDRPRRVWSFQPEGCAAAPLQVRDGAVYLTDTIGTLLALDVVSGQLTVGCEPVLGVGPGRYALEASPAGWDSPATFLSHTGTSTEGSHLTIYDGALNRRWRVSVAEGSLRGVWCAGDDARLAVAAGKAAEIACVVRNARREWQYLWRVKLPGTPIACAPSMDGGLIVCDKLGHIYKLSDNGEIVWREMLPVHDPTAPRRLWTSNDIVLLYGSAQGEPLTAINSHDGSILWQTAKAGRLLGQPAVTVEGDKVILSSRDVGLCLARLDDGTVDIIDGFERPIAGVAHMSPVTSIISVTEYGVDGRILLYDLAQRAVIWSDVLGERGALHAPVICAETIIAQEIDGRIQAWCWEDIR